MNDILQAVNLTKEQFDKFKRGYHNTYQAIGGDLPPDDISREELMEVVCDGGCMEQYGGRRKDGWIEFYNGVVRPLFDKHYGGKHWAELTKLVFPSQNMKVVVELK